MVWIWPLWFGLPPALIKGFVERIFVEGFAIKIGPPIYGRIPNYTPLLKGKSARIVITMQMPALMFRLWCGSGAARGFEHHILRFVGFAPVRRTLFGMIDAAGDAKRGRWLEEMRALGRAGR